MSFYITAITTGRGDMRNEVGIAAINLKYPHLILCQINDTQTYKQTLTKLYQMDPIEVLYITTNNIHFEFHSNPLIDFDTRHHVPVSKNW